MVIVVVAPVRIESPGLQDGIEDLPSEELVASVAVEALHEGVLPGRPRIDVGGSGAGETTPVADGQGDELRPLSQRMNQVRRARPRPDPAPG